jgi:hypothetical protein
MTTWMNGELTKIRAADKLEIAPLRRDGLPVVHVPVVCDL